MDVVILAGGLGTRLRSVVSEVPKCMAPVASRPFLYYLLQWLGKSDVSRVILSVGYMHEKIENWIDENKYDFNFAIDFVLENEPLGTGGAIRLAMNKVNANKAVIINGDTFFDIDLEIFNRYHDTHGAVLSTALKPMRNFDRYGNVAIKKNFITVFKEKQFCTEGLINGGIYIINKTDSFFEGLPKKFSFETEILQPSTDRKIHGFIFDNYFIDIGIPEDYIRANNELINIIL